MIRYNLWYRLQKGLLSFLLPSLVAAGLPLTSFAGAAISANLSWTASSDPNVTGYNIYYGNTSHQYTNSVSVGNVTSVNVPNLTTGTTYFFAAKAHDAAGNQSDFSNEAAFTGVTVTPGTYVQLSTMPTNSTADQLSFSLASGAPAGASIDPTNGTFYWNPDNTHASTTNVINVIITDNTNPNLSSSETLLIVVTDYLNVGLGSTAVQTSQYATLPVVVSASDVITNLQFTINWPASQFATPSLIFGAGVLSGSVQPQGSSIVVNLQLDPSQTFTNASTVAQLNFQAVAGQNSAFVNVQASNVQGTKSDASAYVNSSAQAGQIVVVGNNPLMTPQTSAQGRALTVYGNPNSNYQVQYTTNLVPPVVWLPLSNFQQSSVTQTVTLDDSLPVVYYRIQQL